MADSTFFTINECMRVLNVAKEAMDIPPSLRGKEISLDHIGLSEAAWLKEDVLVLVEHLSANNSFILGGDVLVLEVDGYRHNHDNWYFEYDDGSAVQSVEHTKQYINGYPTGDYAFVLVVGS